MGPKSKLRREAVGLVVALVAVVAAAGPVLSQARAVDVVVLVGTAALGGVMLNRTLGAWRGSRVS